MKGKKENWLFQLRGADSSLLGEGVSFWRILFLRSIPKVVSSLFSPFKNRGRVECVYIGKDKVLFLLCRLLCMPFLWTDDELTFFFGLLWKQFIFMNCLELDKKLLAVKSLCALLGWATRHRRFWGKFKTDSSMNMHVNLVTLLLDPGLYGCWLFIWFLRILFLIVSWFI